MKNNLLKRFLYAFLIIFISSTVFISCSDDGTGVDDIDDQPIIPELTPVEIDISYFLDNSPEFSEETEAFFSASAYAISIGSLLSSGTAIGSLYLEFAKDNEGEFVNGKWEWVETFQQGNESITFKLVATEVTSGFKWELFLSGKVPPFENELNEFLLMDGVVRSDNTIGNWNFYAPDTGTSPYASYSWTVESDNKKTVGYEVVNQDIDVSFNYEQNGDENTISILDAIEEESITVYWNTANNTGYIIQDGVKQCWNSNFLEIECS